MNRKRVFPKPHDTTTLEHLARAYADIETLDRVVGNVGMHSVTAEMLSEELVNYPLHHKKKFWGAVVLISDDIPVDEVYLSSKDGSEVRWARFEEPALEKKLKELL